MNFVTRGASLAVLIALSGGAAQAALTADQLWAAWQNAGGQAGLSVSAESATREGTSLRLSGVRVASGTTGDAATQSPTQSPAAGPTKSEAKIDEILLTEAADGSVTVLPSPELAVVVGDGVNGGTMTLRHTGGSIKVTEALGELTYDMNATDMAVAVAASNVSAMAKPDGTEARTDYKMAMTLANPVVKVTDTPDANRTIGVNLAANTLTYDVRFNDAGTQSTSVQTNTTADIAFIGSFVAPKTIAMDGLNTPQAWAAAFAEGMALSVDVTQGQSTSTAQENSLDTSMDLTATALPGTARFALGRDGYDVRATGQGMQAIVKTNALPVPEVTIDLGPLELAFAMPMVATTSPAPYGLTLKLSDVLVNEATWGLIDPTATLPRDPAQLTLVTKGTMLADFLAQMAADPANPAGVTAPQPQTLDITELMVSAAGALLTGSGAFTFDNASGQPVPAGEANLTLTGGNALIDGLIKIGVMTEEDAGGARMMMAMFMNSAGNDVLTSKIEARADGSILVNGQRVQ